MKFIKENLRLIIAVFIALLLIIIGVILLNTTKEEKKKEPSKEVVEQNKEDKLVDATGMTKEDAIEIVKENFESDNYEFSATVTNDGLYKVVVTNTVDESKIVYFVDPTDGRYYVDLETK